METEYHPGVMEQKEPPEGWAEIDVVMSNFDHVVEPWADERLRNEQVWGRHPGWNFNGLVWFDRKTGLFIEAVYVYRSYRATLSAATLPELMELVSDEFGHD
jgi:hypothetical protein